MSARTLPAQRIVIASARSSWEQLGDKQLTAYRREARRELDVDCGDLQLTHYTAIPTLDGVADPERLHFPDVGLQFKEDGRQHSIRVLVVVTLYNEDRDALETTLRGIAENVSSWGESGREKKLPRFLPGRCSDRLGVEYAVHWSEVLVVIISDGVIYQGAGADANFQEMGLWSTPHVLASEQAHGQDIAAHVFQTTAILRQSDVSKQCYLPLQCVFCGKRRNGGKLSSHHWFFRGFCDAYNNASFVFLVDAGTRPDTAAMVRLCATMQLHPNYGGVCGDITANNPNICDTYFRPVIAAQVLEYRVSNYVGKAMESFFGKLVAKSYISVLPGAFSAYRYEAICGAPLDAYFRSLSREADDWGAFERNMFLAEDRILCAELVSKKKCRYVLSHVRNARAYTDVPTNVVDLMRQRRRWTNGALFATLYALQCLPRLLHDSSHGIIQKLMFLLQFTFTSLNVLISFFIVAVFYIALRGLTNSYFDSFGNSSLYATGQFLHYSFLGLCMVQVMSAVLIDPRHIRFLYTTCSLLFGMFGFVLIGLGVNFVTSQGAEMWLERWLSIGILGSLQFMAMVHKDFHTVPATIVQYFCFLPTFVVIFQIYAMMNTHDVSWGTRDSSGHGSKLTDVRLRRFSIAFATVWMMSNMGVVAAEKLFFSDATLFMRMILRLGAAVQGFQVVFALLYVIRSKLAHDCHAVCWSCSSIYKEYYTELGRSMPRDDAHGEAPTSSVAAPMRVRFMPLWRYCCVAFSQCACLCESLMCMTCCKEGAKRRREQLRSSVAVQSATVPLIHSQSAANLGDSNGSGGLRLAGARRATRAPRTTSEDTGRSHV